MKLQKFKNVNLFNFVDIDYKNPKLCQYVSEYSWKITPRRFSKLKAKIQRKITKEIKKARYLAILPYCAKHKKVE